MYARDVGRQRLTFFVSGKLWSRSLVMQDVQTGSLWSHILGRAMAGPLEGTSLEVIPSVITDWASWRAAHADTTVAMLDRTAVSFNRDMYGRLEEFGLGLVLQGAARFWRLDLLAEQPVVNDQWQGEPLLILFDEGRKSALAFRRQRDDGVLSFSLAGGMRTTDDQTSSVWNPHTGRAVAGPLAGQQLEPVPAIISFTSAWLRFHPESSRWQPAGR